MAETRPRRRPPKAPTPAASAVCAAGDHDQCVGTVYRFPPVRGRAIVPCECKTCQHRPRL